MPLQIVRNNIVNMQADAIVNTANPYPVIGSGVDSCIYKAAGRTSFWLPASKSVQLLRDRQQLHQPMA